MSEKISNTKVSKRMSKLYQKKCRKPKCPKECQNNVEKISKTKVSKKCQKICRNQHLILVVYHSLPPLGCIKYNSVIPVYNTHPNQQVFHEAPQNSTGP
jgi:hypothetical protein